MKILLLCQVLPYPLDSGPKIKTYHVLRHISERHQVTLVSFVRGDETENIEHLKRLCEDVRTVQMRRGFMRDLRHLLRSLISSQPFIILRDQRSAMSNMIRELCAQESYDVVHADQLNMAQYAIAAPVPKKILDAHNALWLLYHRLARTTHSLVSRLVFGRDARLLRKYEGEVGNLFDRVLAVSDEDRDALVDVGVSPERIQVIPIAIDCESTRPIRRSLQAENIVHMGTMFWPPNSEGVEWFLSEIWPHIYRQRPQTEFDIIGARPPQSIVRFAERHPGVNVWGYLDDPSPRLREAAVMVVPLRVGSGIRVKILNAMAEGIPVVTTTIGGEGLHAIAGEHLLIADDPAGFARATLSLIDDRQMADRISHRARDLVESSYDYRKRLIDLDHAYSQLQGSGNGTIL